MSSRAVRALRGDAGGLSMIPSAAGSEEGDDAEDDDDSSEEPFVPRPTAFAWMNDDDDEDDDDNDSHSEESTSEHLENDCILNEEEDQVAQVDQEDPENHDDSKKPPAAKNDSNNNSNNNNNKEVEVDLDALLDEFREKDDYSGGNSAPQEPSLASACPLDIILANLDARDLDYEYSMRSSLLNNNLDDGATTRKTSTRSKAPLFGRTRDGWIRPPRLVGGGLGMTTYDRDPRILPWPYRTTNTSTRTDTDCLPLSQWCTFVHSDSYRRDCEDFTRVVRQSGDLNTLVLFVAHHPYVTTALLQLTTVLYQTNHTQQGLELLQRSLWIYESSALVSFVQNLQQLQIPKRTYLMDYDQPENQPFFDSLFRLIHVSSIAGLSRTSFAASRLLLSLDPLRDPKGVLVILDKHALTASRSGSLTEEVKILQWLIQLVESDTIVLWHRDETDNQIYHCGLLDLPNWCYSYALAIFLLYQASELTNVDISQDSNTESTTVESLKQKADGALQFAMNRYPLVVDLLLRQMEADTTGRSFRRDWVTVLDFCRDRARQLTRHWHGQSSFNTVTLSATMQACDLIIQIFVQQNAVSLWGSDAVQQWMYDNLQQLQQLQQHASQKSTIDAESSAQQRLEVLPSSPSPALMRYIGVDPADYDTRIQTLPPEAAPVDPGLVAHALAMDPRRGRLVRNQRGARGFEQGEHDNGVAAVAAAVDADGNPVPTDRRQPLLGPPTHHVDPDWPLLEVFWRSFLPWNHVDGVPPPRR